MEIILSPAELEQQLGKSLKDLRLQINLSRQALCDQAGVSLNALRHLETGQGATVKTLVRIVRSLSRQDWLAAIAPKVSINPLHLVRNEPSRQRASRRVRTYGKKAKG